METLNNFQQLLHITAIKKTEFTWVFIKLGADGFKMKEHEMDIFKKLPVAFGFLNKSNLAQNSMRQISNGIVTYNQEIISRSQNTLYAYDLQKAVGDSIFEKIEKLIQSQNSNFTSFKAIFLIPPINSLMNQTKERIIQTFNNDQIKALSDKRELNFVRMALKNDLNNFKELINKAKSKPKCLYLVVQDECHWGMQKDGVLNSYLNLDLLDFSNVILLQVSATAYNVEVITKMGWFHDKITIWDEIAKFTEQLKQENKQ